MEYLMSYGWAILTIALVLVVLFDLNIFSTVNFVPKASPGSCIIARPNGPYSLQVLSEEGLCTGSIPMYVYYFPCSWPDPGYCPDNWVNFSVSKTPINMSVSAWFWVPPSNASIDYGGVIFAMSGNSPTMWVGGYHDYGRNINGQHLCASVFNAIGSYACSLDNITPGIWHNAVVTINSSKIYVYVDGRLAGTGAGGSLGGANSGYIGNQTCNCFFSGASGILALYSGYMSNVQLYNSSLNSAQVDNIYAGGIGYAPADLQDLMAWWPLNGNANDYSGNLQNGHASNVIPTGIWYNTYLR